MKYSVVSNAVFVIVFSLSSVMAGDSKVKREIKSERISFGEYASEWRKRKETLDAKMLTEILTELCDYESNLANKYPFNEKLNLSSLPISNVHYPLISRIIEKENPYMKETGLELAARAFDSFLDNKESMKFFEASVAGCLRKGVPDPWIVEAVISYIEAYENMSYNTDYESESIFLSLAEYAYEGKQMLNFADRGTMSGPLFTRQRMVLPRGRARLLIENNFFHGMYDRSEFTVGNVRTRIKGWRKKVLPVIGKYYLTINEDKTVEMLLYMHKNNVHRYNDDGKYGFMDSNGAIVIAPRFEYAENFSGGRALVKYNGLFGYIDYTGSFIIEPKYTKGDSFDYFREVAGVNVEDKLCWIDRNGAIVQSD